MIRSFQTKKKKKKIFSTSRSKCSNPGYSNISPIQNDNSGSFMQWNSLSINTSNEKNPRKTPNPKSLINFTHNQQEQKSQKRRKQKLLFVVPRCQYQMYYGKYILPQNQVKMITRFVHSYNEKLGLLRDYNKITEVEQEIKKQNYELYVNHSMFRKLAVLERKRWFKQHVLKKMFTILKKRRPRPQNSGEK